MVLSLTACAVLTGATSLLTVGEWITDSPPHYWNDSESAPIHSIHADLCPRNPRCDACWPASTATHSTPHWGAGSPTAAHHQRRSRS
ncbi:hypothetical protein [Streptomyces sp. TE5632]